MKLSYVCGCIGLLCAFHLAQACVAYPPRCTVETPNGKVLSVYEAIQGKKIGVLNHGTEVESIGMQTDENRQAWANITWQGQALKAYPNINQGWVLQEHLSCYQPAVSCPAGY